VLVGSGRVFPGMEWDTFDAERERLLGGDLFEFEVRVEEHKTAWDAPTISESYRGATGNRTTVHHTISGTEKQSVGANFS
jgi:hypothetical protein